MPSREALRTSHPQAHLLLPPQAVVSMAAMGTKPIDPLLPLLTRANAAAGLAASGSPTPDMLTTTERKLLTKELPVRRLLLVARALLRASRARV